MTSKKYGSFEYTVFDGMIKYDNGEEYPVGQFSVKMLDGSLVITFDSTGVEAFNLFRAATDKRSFFLEGKIENVPIHLSMVGFTHSNSNFSNEMKSSARMIAKEMVWYYD